MIVKALNKEIIGASVIIEVTSEVVIHIECKYSLIERLFYSNLRNFCASSVSFYNFFRNLI